MEVYAWSLFYMKNKVNLARTNVIITKFDFPFFIEITPVGFIGGLWML